jgi:hypothetical protein
VARKLLLNRNIQIGNALIEMSEEVHPLCLDSSTRLFAELAPVLSSAQLKANFYNGILNYVEAEQKQLSCDSPDASPKTLQLLGLFGNGWDSLLWCISSPSPNHIEPCCFLRYPARIAVKANNCRSDDNLEQVMAEARSISNKFL